METKLKVNLKLKPNNYLTKLRQKELDGNKVIEDIKPNIEDKLDGLQDNRQNNKL